MGLLNWAYPKVKKLEVLSDDQISSLFENFTDDEFDERALENYLKGLPLNKEQHARVVSCFEMKMSEKFEYIDAPKGTDDKTKLVIRKTGQIVNKPKSNSTRGDSDNLRRTALERSRKRRLDLEKNS